MAYNETTAERVQAVVDAGPHATFVVKRKMFGGIAFLRKGLMFVGVVGDDLMVRVGPEGHEGALARPHARPMDFTGRPMRGYVYVGPKGHATARTLAEWVNRGAEFVATLPDKKGGKGGAGRRAQRRARRR